jgi:hypothetical protein
MHLAVHQLLFIFISSHSILHNVKNDFKLNKEQALLNRVGTARGLGTQSPTSQSGVP